MTGKIFRSCFLVGLAVMILCTGLFVAVMASQYEDCLLYTSADAEGRTGGNRFIEGGARCIGSTEDGCPRTAEK